MTDLARHGTAVWSLGLLLAWTWWSSVIPAPVQASPQGAAQASPSGVDVREACQPVVARLQGLGGEPYARRAGAHLRNQLSEAELFSTCLSLQGLDDAGVVSRLTALGVAAP